MALTIYDRAGCPRAELSPDDSSTQAKEIQGDNVLTLSFILYEHIELDVDDYVDFEGERYWLTEQYRPKQISTKEWRYDLRLYGIESLLRNILVIKTVDDENDPVFSLTAPPREHVAMIVRCMNDGMGNITDWKVGQVDGTENIVIDYHGKYCDEALKEIAEKVGAEWWTESQTVNVCRCEHGEPVTLGYDKGLTSIDPGKADNVKFYTRLWPVGSSRNIDPEKYGYSRLQLPGVRKYVEVNADKYGRVDHYEDAAFADIYPRRIGTVSSVRSEVRKGEDGNDFTIYYFRDDSLPFTPDDYMIGGKVIRVSFQEGSELGGLGDEEDGTYYFEVNYHAATREFEIITIWPYDNDMQLPGGSLVPKPGDKYILWNLRMPDEYYGLAEEEFLTAVNKYNADHALDISVFKAPTDHVWIEENAVDLFIGRRVRLESEQFFPGTGYRDSRITKITRKVNLPSQMDIEIGDALGRTAREKMTDDIGDARNYARSIGESISIPDIIRTGDRTLPTDNNLFSARRSQREFLSKNTTDRAKKRITFEEGIDTGKFLPGSDGGSIDGNGDAELRSLLIRRLLCSPEFSHGSLGNGWWLGLDPQGSERSLLVIDKLYVRYKAIFEQLEIKHIRHVGGEIVLSPAGADIVSVDERQVTYYADSYGLKDAGGAVLKGSDGASLCVPDPASAGLAWRCRFRASDGTDTVVNEFAVGDMARCRTFNLTEGRDRYYWRKVVAVGPDYVDLAVDDCDPGVANDGPQAGDSIVAYGNDRDPARQNVISISAYGTDAPSIHLYQGIKGYSTAGTEKIVISPHGSKFTGELVVRTASGEERALAEFLRDAISLFVYGAPDEYSTTAGTVEKGPGSDFIEVPLSDSASELPAGTRLKVRFHLDTRQDRWTGFEYGLFDSGIEPVAPEVTAGAAGGWHEALFVLNRSLAGEPERQPMEFAIQGYGDGADFRISGLSVTRLPLEQELTETGIDIQSGKITLKGDTEIITNDGSTAALFRDGRIKAEYVEAGEVTADRVETRPASDTSKARTVIEGGRQVYYGDDGDVRLLVHSGALSPDNADEGGVLVPQLAATMQATERTATETLVSGVQVSAISQLDLSALSLLAAANFVEGAAPPPDFGDGPYYGTVRLALYDDCGAESTLIAAKTVSIGGTGAFSAAFADFGRVVLQPGEHSLRVEVSLNTALTVSGTWALNAPPAVLPLAGASTATEIAADGAALRAGDSYVKVVGEGTTVKAGNYALRVTEAGIEASNDGGGTWSPIFT